MVAQQLSSKSKLRGKVLGGAFAACIAVGALTGAQLKTDQQKKEAITNFRATSPAEQIAVLEQQKGNLLQQRALIQRKVDLFHERVKEREVEKAERAAKAAREAAQAANGK